MKKIFLAALAALTLFCVQAGAQQNQSIQGGGKVASAYGQWRGSIVTGNTGTGTQTITVAPALVTLSDGRVIQPWSVTAPIAVDLSSGSVTETVTPTAVSCNQSGGTAMGGTCNITASFTNAHGSGISNIQSGTFGIMEAVNDAFSSGGGAVFVDRTWQGGNQLLNTFIGPSNTSVSTIPYPSVTLVDTRFGVPQYWNAQGGATTLAAPATLVNTTTVGITVNGANATAGFYTNSAAYFVCIAYVDLAGQEGPCSATMSFTPASGTTNQIGFTAPAASTGAVGWVPYISLTSGSYVLAYKVPLVAQPTVVGAYPASNGVCTLTTLETTTPACAVTNATYGQTGVGAVVSALTLNTSPIDPQVTTISTTTVYTPNAGGRTTYTYAPGSHLGTPGIITSTLPFTIGAAAATVVPDVVGTVNVAPGFMNVVGKTLEICGEMTTTASAATIVDVQFQWDAVGQNTAGKGILIGDLTATPSAAIATAGHASFCQQFQTTVASASATGGSINHVNSYGSVGGVTLIGTGALSDAVTPGAIGSLNLAVDARINIIYLHTTATDGAGWTLQNLTAKLI